MTKRTIYGVKYRYNFGWEVMVYKFSEKEEAEKWLRSEECGFWSRELCNKKEAMHIAGSRKLVENAEFYDPDAKYRPW